ncbi:unnamed protein product [Lampetra planeri]
MEPPTDLRRRRTPELQVVTDEQEEPPPPAHGAHGLTAGQVARRATLSGRAFRVSIGIMLLLLLIPLAILCLFVDSPINPQPYSYAEPPPLTGLLQPNEKLRGVERLFQGQLMGPESIVTLGDVLYTGTADGRILKIEKGEISTLARFGKPPCGRPELEPTCGRPLGIRVSPNGTLLIADAYLGLFEVDPVTGKVLTLVSSQEPVEGHPMGFINDLTVTSDGTRIYFTDSSSKWQRRNNRYLVMEATADGRLFEYNMVQDSLRLLMDGLRFPNGVQLTPNEDALLVAETTMARVLKYRLSGQLAGASEIFADNLPGFPDNIRASGTGGYWLAMAGVRPNPGFSFVDFLAPRPWLKSLLFKVLSQEVMMQFVPRHGLLLELGPDGTVRRSLHDPAGTMVPSVSEAHEHDGWLYLGSYHAPFISRLQLSKI